MPAENVTACFLPRNRRDNQALGAVNYSSQKSMPSTMHEIKHCTNKIGGTDFATAIHENVHLYYLRSAEWFSDNGVDTRIPAAHVDNHSMS